MKWIGLTGGIASGKSTVTKRLRQLGYVVVDADELAKQVVQPGTEGLRQVIQHFGNQFINPDGSLNRKKLGDYIFSHKNEKDTLENIIHPKVQEEVRKQKEAALKKGEKIAFYDVPLLFEKKLEAQFDATILVFLEKEKQIDRLQKRDGLTKEEAEVRLINQMPIDAKKQKAKFILDNNGSVEELHAQIDKLLESIIAVKT